jgi:hypothetical protein
MSQPQIVAATPAGDEIDLSLDAVNDQFPDDEDDVDASKVDVSQLASAIVGAVNAAQGPRKVKAGEYQRTRSEHRDKPQLTKKIMQNGIMLTRRQQTADAINMLNALRPGIHADGFITIVAMRDGQNGTALDIQYPSKTVDDRMNFKSRWPTFEHMLAAVLREQSA